MRVLSSSFSHAWHVLVWGTIRIHRSRVPVLCISSNTQCGTVQKYETLLETVMAHPVCMHCLVSPPSSPVRTSNDELEHNARLFNSHRLRNHCCWPIQNDYLILTAYAIIVVGQFKIVIYCRDIVISCYRRSRRAMVTGALLFFSFRSLQSNLFLKDFVILRGWLLDI